jgi:hypothetical protein
MGILSFQAIMMTMSCQLPQELLDFLAFNFHAKTCWVNQNFAVAIEGAKT